MLTSACPHFMKGMPLDIDESVQPMLEGYLFIWSSISAMLKEAPMPASSSARRAGTYHRQPTGYRAFIPAPLPPDPPVDSRGELQACSPRPTSPSAGSTARSRRCRTPTCSSSCTSARKRCFSQIEGTQSSLQDLLGRRGPALRSGTAASDVDEVVNYVAAMNHGLARLAELPVSVRLIREIHAKLLRGVRGSQLDARRVAPHPELDRPGRLHAERGHVRSAAAGDVLPQALGDLERFLHADNTICRCSSRSAWRTHSSRRSTRSSTATAASGAC